LHFIFDGSYTCKNIVLIIISSKYKRICFGVDLQIGIAAIAEKINVCGCACCANLMQFGFWVQAGQRIFIVGAFYP